MSTSNPHAGQWYVRRKSDGKYLTFDGWGRLFWVDESPGAYWGPLRSDAVAAISGQGVEDDFDFLQVPGAPLIENALDLTALLKR